MASPYPHDPNVPQAVPAQAVPVQAVPAQAIPAQNAPYANAPYGNQPTGQPAPYAVQPQTAQQAQYGAQQPGGVQYVTPNYGTVAPELQVMDANKIHQQPQQHHQVQVHPASAGFEFLGGRRQFLIKQRFEAIESAAQAIGCGCIEFKNKYDVFDLQTGQPLLLAKEDSNMFCRACCKPNHTLTLNVFDVSRGMETNVLRVEKPFKCNCCVCFDLCAHSQTAFLGNNRPLGGAKKHIPCGGCCTPQLDLTDSKGAKDGMVTGPFCCVGGCLELFKDIKFEVKNEAKQPIGSITKKKPADMQASLKEAVGDADTFIIDLDRSLSDEKTANLLATALLMDYIFFEGGPPFKVDPLEQSVECNCFTCYVMGCVCPCACKCGGNQQPDEH